MENRRVNSSAPSEDRLWIRVLILGIYCVLVNLWVVSHFGDDFLTALVAPIALSFFGVMKFLADLLGGSVKNRLSGRMRASVARLASPSLLAALWLVFVVVSSFVSSVTVLADGQTDPIRVHLGVEGDHAGMSDSAILSGPNSAVRFVCLTSPFGRPFYITADGFLRYSFDLRTWGGQTIRLTSDLSVSPSLLIRVPLISQPFLDGARIVILNDRDTLANVSVNSKQGAVLLGRPATVYQEFITQWRYELAAGRIAEDQAARSIMRWSRPVTVRSQLPIVPDQLLSARLVLPSGEIVAEEQFTVGGGRLQDILLASRRDL